MSTAWSEPEPVLKSTSSNDSISKSAREGEHRARSSTVDKSPSGVCLVATSGSFSTVSARLSMKERSLAAWPEGALGASLADQSEWWRLKSPCYTCAGTFCN